MSSRSSDASSRGRRQRRDASPEAGTRNVVPEARKRNVVPQARERNVVQRVRVDAQGYDDTGAYWGAGPDVFIATSADGSDQITVRARDLTEARSKIDAERNRAAGEPCASRDPIGGNAPRKTRFEIQWQNPVTREAVRICITHSRDYLASGSDHVEVESIRPKRAPLPISETGYRSHFMPALELANAGGPVVFVTAWIEREAKTKAWTAAASARAQGDLFQWADAQGEVGARRKPRSARPAAKARRKPAGGRAPE